MQYFTCFPKTLHRRKIADLLRFYILTCCGTINLHNYDSWPKWLTRNLTIVNVTFMIFGMISILRSRYWPRGRFWQFFFLERSCIWLPMVKYELASASHTLWIMTLQRSRLIIRLRASNINCFHQLSILKCYTLLYNHYEYIGVCCS